MKNEGSGVDDSKGREEEENATLLPIVSTLGSQTIAIKLHDSPTAWDIHLARGKERKR